MTRTSRAVRRKRLVQPHPKRSEIRAARTGWLLFIVSAGFFVASSIRSGDPLALAGSMFFLLACFFFLPPLFAEDPENSERQDPDVSPRGRWH